MIPKEIVVADNKKEEKLEKTWSIIILGRNGISLSFRGTDCDRVSVPQELNACKLRI